MTPKEWAEWFREKHKDESIPNLVSALRSAAKYGFWHTPEYAELVIKYLEKLK